MESIPGLSQPSVFPLEPQGQQGLESRANEVLERWYESCEERAAYLQRLSDAESEKDLAKRLTFLSEMPSSGAGLLEQVWRLSEEINELVLELIKRPRSEAEQRLVVLQSKHWEGALTEFERHLSEGLKRHIFSINLGKPDSCEAISQGSDWLLGETAALLVMEEQLASHYRLDNKFGERNIWDLDRSRERLFEEALKLYSRLYPDTGTGELIQERGEELRSAWTVWNVTCRRVEAALQEAASAEWVEESCERRMPLTTSWDRLRQGWEGLMAQFRRLDEELFGISGSVALDPRYVRVLSVKMRFEIQWTNVVLERTDQVLDNWSSVRSERYGDWKLLCRQLLSEGEGLIPDLERVLQGHDEEDRQFCHDLKTYVSEMKEALEANASSDEISGEDSGSSTTAHARKSLARSIKTDRLSQLKSYSNLVGPAALAALILLLVALGIYLKVAQLRHLLKKV